MIKQVIAAVLFALGCAGAVDEADELQLGTAEQAYKTKLNGAHEVWGSNGLAPYEKCTDNGSSSQICQFVKPEQTGDSFFGTPTRYRITSTSSGFSSQDYALVMPATQGITAHINQELAVPQMIIPVTYQFSEGQQVLAINITGGTVPGSAGSTRTDNYFTLTFNGCSTLGDSLQGTYKHCNGTFIVLDVPKLRTNFPQQTAFSRALVQVIAKAILTSLGAGRTASGFTVRDIYPANATLPQNYFTSGEKAQMQCVGFTASAGGLPPTFGVADPCGLLFH